MLAVFAPQYDYQGEVTVMQLVEVSNMLHVLCAVTWIGGLLFLLVAMAPCQPDMIRAAMRFRPFMLGAMTLILATGFTRVFAMGGFKAIPVPIHIKIGLGMLMLVLSLLSALVFLPKANRALESGDTAELPGVKAFVWASTATVILALGVLGILAANGLL